MIFIGIDPGKHGAVAWMDGDRKTIEVVDCPLEVGGDYHFQAMADIVRRFPTDSLVTLELVDSFKSDRHWQAFGFGIGYGAWLGILGSFALCPQLVRPQVWKRTMLAGIANDKRAEGKALVQRFQGHEIVSKLYGPRGGLHDGRVDALFLAEYGRLQHRLLGKRAA